MDQIDVDAIVRDIRSRVQARRADGDYPLGLEAQLEAEFDLIMKGVHRDDIDTAPLGESIRRVEASAAAGNAEAAAASRLPGGSVLHTVASRLVQRQTGKLSETTRALGADITASLREIHHLIDAQRNADERQLKEVIASVIDRIALLDQVASAVLDLERRVGLLESATPAST